MREFKGRDADIGDQVPEQMFLPETLGQALSMIADYSRTHGLSPVELCRTFNAGIGAIAQGRASSRDPALKKVWIGSGDA